MELYNCVQTNDYQWIRIVTLNHIVVYRLLVLDRNTLNHTTLFVVDSYMISSIPMWKNDYRQFLKSAIK